MHAVKYLVEQYIQCFQLPYSLQNHQTALHLAAAGGHTEVVGQLLNHGADVNVQDTVSKRRNMIVIE